MQGFRLVIEARKRAGLTQADLASRVGTTQSAIARLERGGSSPSLERISTLVDACGLELHVGIQESDLGASEWRPPLVSALELLARHQVIFVVAGAAAAALRGAAIDAPVPEVVPEESLSNMERLSSVLDAHGARARTSDGRGSLPFDRTPAGLRERRRWSLTTTEGDLDIAFAPAGTHGYRDLVRDASPVGELLVASLADAIRELEASGADPAVVHGLRRSFGSGKLGAS